MSSSNYNPGPYWTVNSNEVGAGIMIIGFIISIPALPAGVLGWWIGVHIVGNNFAKWGLMVLFFALMYAFVIYIHERKGLKYSVGVVALEYLIYDYITMLYLERDFLVTVKIITSIINWGLSLN